MSLPGLAGQVREGCRVYDDDRRVPRSSGDHCRQGVGDVTRDPQCVLAGDRPQRRRQPFLANLLTRPDESTQPCRVVAIRRAASAGALEHPPRRDTRLAPDDDAYLVGPYAELLEVLRHDREVGSAPAA